MAGRRDAWALFSCSSVAEVSSPSVWRKFARNCFSESSCKPPSAWQRQACHLVGERLAAGDWSWLGGIATPSTLPISTSLIRQAQVGVIVGKPVQNPLNLGAFGFALVAIGKRGEDADVNDGLVFLRGHNLRFSYHAEQKENLALGRGQL